MKTKNILVLFLLGIGIFCTMILPMGFWFNHDGLSQMGVVKELWGYMLTGIICILIAIRFGELE